MENNKHIFPYSNLCLILEKVREALGPMQSSDILCLFSQRDSCANGVIEADDFRDLLLQLVKCSLNEHEVITVSRAFKIEAEEPGPDMNTLKSVIQTELSKKGYDRFYLQRIEYTLRYHDPCRTGLVDRHTLRSTLLAARIPVAKELINFLIDNFEPGDECDRINYCKVMEFLDYVKHPSYKANPTNLACILKWLEPKRPPKIYCVNYRAFLEEVCPNFKCSLPEVCCPVDPCCDDPCNADPVETQIPSNDCCPRFDIDERRLAGRVITDNNPWNEKDRCDAYEGSIEDPCSSPLAFNPCAMNDMGQPVSAYIDFDLEKAYQPSPPSCEAVESGKQEVFHCGDYIGFEDLYGKKKKLGLMCQC